MTGASARLGAALDEFVNGTLSELAGIRGELSQLRAEATVRWAFVATQLAVRAEAEVQMYDEFLKRGHAEDEKLAQVIVQAREAEAEAVDRASGRVARLLQEVASHGWLTSGIGTTEGPDGLQPAEKETEEPDASASTQD